MAHPWPISKSGSTPGDGAAAVRLDGVFEVPGCPSKLAAVSGVDDIAQHTTTAPLPASRAGVKIAGMPRWLCQIPREVSMRTIIVGALCAIAMVANANAAIKEEPVTYTDGDDHHEGLRRLRRRHHGQAARDHHGA